MRERWRTNEILNKRAAYFARAELSALTMRPLSIAGTAELTDLLWREGDRAQAIGPSPGGQTTKTHALTNALAWPGVLLLTPCTASDVTTVPRVLVESLCRIRRLGADRGYDVDRLRIDLCNSKVMPIIPGNLSRKRRIQHDMLRYRERWHIKAMLNRLKRFRRIATRYDKLARSYASAHALPAISGSKAGRPRPYKHYKINH